MKLPLPRQNIIRNVSPVSVAQHVDEQTLFSQLGFQNGAVGAVQREHKNFEGISKRLLSTIIFKQV